MQRWTNTHPGYDELSQAIMYFGPRSDESSSNAGQNANVDRATLPHSETGASAPAGTSRPQSSYQNLQSQSARHNWGSQPSSQNQALKNLKQPPIQNLPSKTAGPGNSEKGDQMRLQAGNKYPMRATSGPVLNLGKGAARDPKAIGLSRFAPSNSDPIPQSSGSKRAEEPSSSHEADTRDKQKMKINEELHVGSSLLDQPPRWETREELSSLSLVRQSQKAESQIEMTFFKSDKIFQLRTQQINFPLEVVMFPGESHARMFSIINRSKEKSYIYTLYDVQTRRSIWKETLKPGMRHKFPFEVYSQLDQVMLWAKEK